MFVATGTLVTAITANPSHSSNVDRFAPRRRLWFQMECCRCGWLWSQTRSPLIRLKSAVFELNFENRILLTTHAQFPAACSLAMHWEIEAGAKVGVEFVCREMVMIPFPILQSHEIFFAFFFFQTYGYVTMLNFSFFSARPRSVSYRCCQTTRWERYLAKAVSGIESGIQEEYPRGKTWRHWVAFLRCFI